MKKITKTRRGPRFDSIGRIKEFRDSGLPCDRVYYPHANAASCWCSLYQAIKRSGASNLVKVVRSGDYILLIRLDL